MRKDQDIMMAGIRSDTLWRIDNALFDLEESNRLLIEERNSLREEVRDLTSKAFAKSSEDFGNMIAGGLMACIGQPSIKSMTPAAVTMLSRIREMKTVEEIHAYVNDFMEVAKEELAEQEVEK